MSVKSANLFDQSHPWASSSSNPIDSRNIMVQRNDVPDITAAIHLATDFANQRALFSTVSNPFSDEDFDRSSDFSSSSSTFNSLNIVSGFAGTILGSADKSITESINQGNISKASQGLGPNGHAFDATYHAVQEASHQSTMASVENAEIGLGSMFGPEGLGVGLAAAGVTSMIGNVTSPSQDTTMSTSGQPVNAADY